jgi:low temperature requirement protein LtrA
MSLGAMGGSIGLGLATIAVLAKLYSDARSAHAEYVESGGEPATEAPRGAFSFAYTLMAVGAVVVAAGVMLVLTDPWEAASATTIAAVLGGPAIFLVGDLRLNRAVSGRIAASRILALAGLAVLALIGFALPALVLAALAFAVLLLLLLAASGWFRLPSMSVNDGES